jgi:hypothetical protein
VLATVERCRERSSWLGAPRWSRPVPGGAGGRRAGSVLMVVEFRAVECRTVLGAARDASGAARWLTVVPGGRRAGAVERTVVKLARCRRADGRGVRSVSAGRCSLARFTSDPSSWQCCSLARLGRCRRVRSPRSNGRPSSWLGGRVRCSQWSSWELAAVERTAVEFGAARWRWSCGRCCSSGRPNWLGAGDRRAGPVPVASSRLGAARWEPSSTGRPSSGELLSGKLLTVVELAVLLAVVVKLGAARWRASSPRPSSWRAGPCRLPLAGSVPSSWLGAGSRRAPPATHQRSHTPQYHHTRSPATRRTEPPERSHGVTGAKVIHNGRINVYNGMSGLVHLITPHTLTHLWRKRLRRLADATGGSVQRTPEPRGFFWML